ncbi:MAG: molecular chaperone [Deltaproteobacteria bacterium]|nr:molecular chaperone [Deltaproteobacteria bacterium]
MFLSAKTRSALLTIRNESGDTLRFQLNVFAWDQSPQGEVLLSPTEDIVFFPPLLTLAPGEERRVRIGTVTPVASSEKTYRIFVEELPPSSKPGRAQGEAEVRLVTKMGIPIFIQPDNRLEGTRVQEMVIRRGLLSFQIRNTGNVHFVPEDIRVKGYGPGGDTLFERRLEGWYILAGGHRSYELEIPKGDCAKLKTLAVEVGGQQQSVKERLEVPPSACD